MAPFTIIPGPGALVNDESGNLTKATARPDLYAKALRELFENCIPKTADDYFDMPEDRRLTTLQVEYWLRDNANCSPADAERLSIEVFPELWATYWKRIFG